MTWRGLLHRVKGQTKRFYLDRKNENGESIAAKKIIIQRARTFSCDTETEPVVKTGLNNEGTSVAI